MQPELEYVSVEADEAAAGVTDTASPVSVIGYAAPVGSFDDWRQTVVAVGTRGSARILPWHLGDLLAAGEARFGEEYAAVVADLEALGYRPSTLTQLLFVAKHVPLKRRREAVDWSHHREVASLTPEQQAEYLELCEAEGLSVKDLRTLLAEKGLRKSRARAPKVCEGCEAYAEQVDALQARIAALEAEIARGAIDGPGAGEESDGAGAAL